MGCGACGEVGFALLRMEACHRHAFPAKAGIQAQQESRTQRVGNMVERGRALLLVDWIPAFAGNACTIVHASGAPTLLLERCIQEGRELLLVQGHRARRSGGGGGAADIAGAFVFDVQLLERLFDVPVDERP